MQSNQRRVFEGINIADFTWAAAGPVTTRGLASYGATVVKVESATTLDITRTSVYKDRKPGVNRGGMFAFLNTDKYSITIDLHHPLGLQVARRLVRWADIVVENFSPGVMDSLGLGYEDLKKIKPDIIMMSTSNQGQTGPAMREAGYGYTLTSMVGLTALTGWPDREPALPWGALTDMYSAWLGTTALIAALDHRRRTGEGQYLDISQCEASLVFMAPLLLDFQVNGHEVQRIGNRSSTAAPHGVYTCKGEDRWCVIAVGNDKEWQLFCQAIGNPKWCQDYRFANLEGRKANEDELDMFIGEWTMDKKAEEVVELLQSVGVAAGIVCDASDLLNDPQLQHRKFFKKLEHPEIGLQSYERPPYILSETPAQVSVPGPLLGQHNEHVCINLLGMTEEEFSEYLLHASTL